MTKLNKLSFALWVFVLLSVTIGSLLPLNKVPNEAFMMGDKFLHLTAYLAIGTLALLGSRYRKAQVGLLGISFGVSVLIEFVQPLTGRSFELMDILANGTGLFVAIPLVSYAIYPLIKRYILNINN